MSGFQAEVELFLLFHAANAVFYNRNDVLCHFCILWKMFVFPALMNTVIFLPCPWQSGVLVCRSSVNEKYGLISGATVFVCPLNSVVKTA